jgi:hypothetical protein
MKKMVLASAFAFILTGACMAEKAKQGAGIGRSSSNDTSITREIARDGTLIAYDNGTVRDTKTGLMWASRDNGETISWDEAKEYCKEYRAGGYDDWRMPTENELATLYDPAVTNTTRPTGGCKGGYHITNLIHITCCCIWAWDGITEVESFFHFDLGPKGWSRQSLSYHPRALPVRDDG